MKQRRMAAKAAETTFFAPGLEVYNSDAVERGRRGWAQYPDIFKGERCFSPQPILNVSHR